MQAEQAKQTILTFYPDFTITSVASHPEGQYNDVFEINSEWIFRFPKFSAGAEQMALEIILLKAIAPYLSLPIPRPEMNHVETAVPERTFCGYRKLAGQPFWPRTYRSLPDDAARMGIARQLGRFLHDLHQLPIREMVQAPLPLCDTVAEWTDIYNRIQTQLFPLMRLEACKTVAVHFEDYLYQPAHHEYTPCLRHGDFGSSNLLFEPQKQIISGILDFSFTTLGDPAVDFAGLLMYGEEFVREMTAVHPQLPALWPRIHFYKGSFALLEALYGIEHGDQEALQAGLAEYI
jgi:aminoglycoside 2''-phosphotransferase